MIKIHTRSNSCVCFFSSGNCAIRKFLQQKEINAFLRLDRSVKISHCLEDYMHIEEHQSGELNKVFFNSIVVHVCLAENKIYMQHNHLSQKRDD